MTTADRLLNVLSLFTIEHPEWTVEEAAGELGLAVSTAYRYFRSLSKAGLIVAFSAGRYVLGPAIIQYDRQIRLRDPLTNAAQPTMKQLTKQMPVQTVILLCRLFRNQVICVHQESAHTPDFAFSYERGRGMPLFRGATSKVILANMPLRTVKALYAEQASKFAQAALGKNWDEARERLRTLRNTGYAVSQGEVDPGMCGVAVPLFDQSGAPVGSLSIVVPMRNVTPKFLKEAPQLLLEGAQQIHWTASLGSHEATDSKPAKPAPATTATKAKRRGARRTGETRAPRKAARRARA